MPAGRPTDYSKELSDRICERLAAGESMRSVSRDESMPCMATMFRWLREKPEFKEQYVSAKEESADALVEDMLDIADNQVDDIALDSDGKPILVDGKPIKIKTTVAVSHARLRVDTRKWAASKLKPKKYGDKLALGGADDLPPIQIRDATLTEEQALALLAKNGIK